MVVTEIGACAWSQAVHRQEAFFHFRLTRLDALLARKGRFLWRIAMFSSVEVRPSDPYQRLVLNIGLG